MLNHLAGLDPGFGERPELPSSVLIDLAFDRPFQTDACYAACFPQSSNRSGSSCTRTRGPPGRGFFMNTTLPDTWKTLKTLVGEPHG